MPFHIDPDALYSLDELEDLLKGIVDVKTFFERLGLRGNRAFRDAIFGREIFAALEKAGPYTTQRTDLPSRGRGKPAGPVRSAPDQSQSRGPGRVKRLGAKDLDL